MMKKQKAGPRQSPQQSRRRRRAAFQSVGRGPTPECPIRIEKGVYVFDLPSDTPPVTTEHVQRADEQLP
jgi:hypothetical protein